MSDDRQIAFKWEWNISTLAVISGFVAGFVAWGYTLAELKAGRLQNAENIQRLTQENVAASTRIDIIDRTLVKHEQYEYRLAQLEKAIESTDTRISRLTENYSNQFAEFRTQLSAISTQVALTNQTLSRMERAKPMP